VKEKDRTGAALTKRYGCTVLLVKVAEPLEQHLIRQRLVLRGTRDFVRTAPEQRTESERPRLTRHEGEAEDDRVDEISDDVLEARVAAARVRVRVSEAGPRAPRGCGTGAPNAKSTARLRAPSR
jgi:hypothetical protein